MPLVDAPRFFAELRDSQAQAAAVRVEDLSLFQAALEAAEHLRLPLVGLLPALDDPLHEALCAAAEVLAERARAPLVLHQAGVASVEEAAFALNRGATSLSLPRTTDGPARQAVLDAARACGAACLGEGWPGPDGEADWLEPSEGAQVVPLAAPLSAMGPGEEGAAGPAHRWVARMEALARDEALWARLTDPQRVRRPVDHVILFNVEGLDEAGVREMLDEGARALGAIPGVRDLAAGISVKGDAAYRYHWMVRFAHPGVIPYYRDHPAHVAFADGRFRPVAGNRVSIDFRHLSRARGGRPL